MRRITNITTIMALSVITALVAACSEQKKSEEKPATPAPAATQESEPKPAAEAPAAPAPSTTSEPAGAPATTTEPPAAAPAAPETTPPEEKK
ncbi:MAG TPA: hypothetical protein PKD49_11570 [Hyphomicrobium sp.]|nr:hypothetical protein [Hyphomicrobium sp.]